MALEEIMQRVAARRMLTLRYREEKTLSILQHALVSTGRMAYRPPDTLIREVNGDPPIRYPVCGSTIEVEKDGISVREIQFDEHPLLGGNIFASIHHYQTASELTRFLSYIIIMEHAGKIRSIETQEMGGDSSLMTLTASDG